VFFTSLGGVIHRLNPRPGLRIRNTGESSLLDSGHQTVEPPNRSYYCLLEKNSLLTISFFENPFFQKVDDLGHSWA
jgi:hypothetical protein